MRLIRCGGSVRPRGQRRISPRCSPPISVRMKKLLEDPAAFYTSKVRPSGHDIGKGFAKDNGGAIPPNLLQIPNTESNGQYLDGCKRVGEKQHPARFPAKLPEFFINMLTEPMRSRIFRIWASVFCLLRNLKTDVPTDSRDSSGGDGARHRRLRPPKTNRRSLRTRSSRRHCPPSRLRRVGY
jgi:hypothetical protein